MAKSQDGNLFLSLVTYETNLSCELIVYINLYEAVVEFLKRQCAQGFFSEYFIRALRHLIRCFLSLHNDQ